MHPAFFYRPGERLTLAELGAARLDGHVVEVGDGFMPADTIESSAARAMSIAAMIPSHAAAIGPTAAWIHGAGDLPPGIHHLVRTGSVRKRVEISHRLVYHERPLREEEVQILGGVQTATALVTAERLLFDTARRTADTVWLHALLSAVPTLAQQLYDRVTPISRRPGSLHAGRLLAEVVRDHDVVTR